jgi:hypothetical protein
LDDGSDHDQNSIEFIAEQESDQDESSDSNSSRDSPGEYSDHEEIHRKGRAGVSSDELISIQSFKEGDRDPMGMFALWKFRQGSNPMRKSGGYNSWVQVYAHFGYSIRNYGADGMGFNEFGRSACGFLFLDRGSAKH